MVISYYFPYTYVEGINTEKNDFIASRIKQFETLSQKHGHPVTIQRRIILEILLPREDHPGPEEILSEAKKHFPQITLVTVKRALESLFSLGVINKIPHWSSKARYEANITRHNHVSCLRCFKLIDIHLEDKNPNQCKVPEEPVKGFSLADCSVFFRGYCPDCASNEAAV